ncbi:MAG: alanine racemase [Tepidisphaeraceae bacterium]
MNCKENVTVAIDYARVRQNAEEIVRATGVDVYAVVKANGYGLGARAVARAIGDVVQGFVVFSVAEAKAYDLWQLTGKPTLCIGPPLDATAEDFLRLHARPAVSSVEEARRLRAASPVLSVDTGMQRFACPAENVAEALAAGNCTEAFTHAVRADQAARLVELVGGRDRGIKLHAAATALLDDPACRLDAVRPGLALYRGAVRISAPLIETRATRGPAGYTGFVTPHVGVILAGYARGFRPGPCLVNGRPSRVLEVGMQSSFIETNETDRAGDEVVLLGDGLEGEQIGAAWKGSAQAVLVQLLAGAGS